MSMRRNSTKNIKEQVYEEWVKNPYTTAIKTCNICHFDYQQHGKYVNNLLSQFRSHCDLGLPQEPHRLEHRTFEWTGIDRVYDIADLMAVVVWKVGWRVNHPNRNEMWVFRDDLGSVHWYKKGLVRLYLKGELQLAKVKELFCKAFSFMPQDRAFFEKYLDVPLKEVYRKWVFDMGKPVPKFDIRTFERSHGLRIFTDLSHPTSVHVGEAQPFWLAEQHHVNEELSGVIQNLGIQITSHLELIKLWQDEAKGNRVARVENAQTIEKECPNRAVASKSDAFNLQEYNDLMYEY